MRFAVVKINGKYNLRPADEVRDEDAIDMIELDSPEQAADVVSMVYKRMFEAPMPYTDLNEELDRERTLFEDDQRKSGLLD